MNILLLSAEPCRALVDLVRNKGMGCEHVVSCQEALSCAEDGSFDAVLLHKPSLGLAVALLRTLRAPGRAGCAESTGLPILVMTAQSDAGTNARLLDMGVEDVVAATCEPDELLARLRSVVRRARGFARPFLSFGPLTLDPQGKRASINNRDVPVTAREFEVLETLVLRRGRVIGKNALLSRLYDGAEEPDQKAINVLVCRLRKKLDAAGAGGLISTAWGNGYSLTDCGLSGNALAA